MTIDADMALHVDTLNVDSRNVDARNVDMATKKDTAIDGHMHAADRDRSVNSSQIGSSKFTSEQRTARLLLFVAISSIGGGLAVPWLFTRDLALMLGSSESGFHNAAIVQLLFSAVVALPLARACYSPTRVRSIVIGGVVFAGLMLVWTATVADSGTFLLSWGLIGAGLCTAAIAGPQFVALLGFPRPEAWTRSALTLGIGFGAGVSAVSPQWFDVTWRGTLLVLLALVLPAVVSVGTVRSPKFAELSAEPRERVVEENEALLSVGESVAAVLNVREAKPALLAASASSGLVTGLLLWGLPLLGDRFGVSISARAFCVALGCLSAVGLAQMRLYCEVEGSFVLVISSCVLGFLLTLIPRNGLVSGGMFVASLAFAGAAWAGADQSSASGHKTSFRPTAAALRVIFAATAGVVAILLADTVDRRFGTAAALGTLCGLALLVGSIGMRSATSILRSANAAQAVQADVAQSGAAQSGPAQVDVAQPAHADPPIGAVQAGDELLVEEAAQLTGSTSQTIGAGPLLDVQNVDFSYGQVQILFNVSLTVQPGEFVALLGTNGAGKSTLLRLISGQGLPQHGSVYFGGVDVTALNAVRRVPLGMSQIPGGKAVFGPLTVAENLDLFSVVVGEVPALRAKAIEQAYEIFPKLAERREQAAETLSGGEQQMLALSKALMTSPRLLCIDELSLGLAPAVVAELLEILRSIHASGTTIVLVEQSLNVALAIADRAVFMEKGEVRYDGPAEELRNREDLLRSVFFASESGLDEANPVTG